MTLVGFDFDRVLFKTDNFKQYLDHELPGFLESYPEGLYDVNKHAEKMNIDVEEVYRALDRAEDFVYDDIGLVQELEGFDAIIVSRGDYRFQRRKIEQSEVLEHFEGMEIVSDEDKDSVGIDFLVDDRAEEVQRVDVPGMVFDREKHSMQDAINRIREEFS